MDNFSHITYLELLVVACGFLIVLITKYSFRNSEWKINDDSIPRRKDSFQSVNTASSSRHSHSSSSLKGYSKRRGRRTFGIKHL